MINVDTFDLETDPARYALALAELLERNEDITFGPTDQELCAQALRDRADLIDAGLA
ncbi:hypothetical protein [Bradyrhizobium nitroreducens]|uniref:hypothetical protein n=1 Tax=Bradyrhizobium nitroreducens TaxID=709803 RepID=UPI0013751EBD|nr:hypothetical protein [Bradyrhizobium nitroreducens]